MKVTLKENKYDVKFDLDFVAEAKEDNETSSYKFEKLVKKLRVGEMARVRQNSQIAIWKRVDARQNEGSALKNIHSICW